MALANRSARRNGCEVYQLESCYIGSTSGNVHVDRVLELPDCRQRDDKGGWEGSWQDCLGREDCWGREDSVGRGGEDSLNLKDSLSGSWKSRGEIHTICSLDPSRALELHRTHLNPSLTIHHPLNLRSSCWSDSASHSLWIPRALGQSTADSWASSLAEKQKGPATSSQDSLAQAAWAAGVRIYHNRYTV